MEGMARPLNQGPPCNAQAASSEEDAEDDVVAVTETMLLCGRPSVDHCCASASLGGAIR